MNSNKFKNSNNENIGYFIEHTILEEDNPFPRNPVCSLDDLPTFCLGRDEEIGKIKTAIEEVAKDVKHNSSWIQICGSGGTGKTTIALYIYNKIKKGESRDLNLQYLECAYIDCPRDHSNINLNYLYKLIIKDLGIQKGNFFYELSFLFLKELYSYLSNDKNFNVLIKQKFSYLDMSKINSYFEFQQEIHKLGISFAKELIEVIKKYDYFFRNNPDIGINFDFIIKLISLLSEDYKIRESILNDLTEVNNNSEDIAHQNLINIMNTLNFLYKKNCLLIIIDNLENLPKDENSVQKLFKLFLQFRNTIKNCVILTIGSIDFWNHFNKCINFSELNMIKGFLRYVINLTNLSEIDAAKIMEQHIKTFWDKFDNKKPTGDDSLFPFSRKAFQYIYEINNHNLRESLKNLYNIIENFKKEKRVQYISNMKEAIYNFRPPGTSYIYINEKNFLDSELEKYSDRNQLSRDLEIGIFNALEELRKAKYKKEITQIQHEPPIKISDGTICKPDIFITFFGKENILDQRCMEIQIKTYFPYNPVKLKEIESSIKLLKENKSHYLNFFTLSDLELRAKDELQKFGPKVGRTAKLLDEEPASFLLFHKDYSKIFFHKETPDVNIIEELFKNLNFDLNKIIENIKKIPSKIEPPITETSKEIQPQPIDIQTILPVTPKQIKIEPKVPDTPPPTPLEKISNANKLKDILYDYIKQNQPVETKEKIYEAMKKYAKSNSVIENAISILKENGKIYYKRPKGWFSS